MHQPLLIQKRRLMRYATVMYSLVNHTPTTVGLYGLEYEVLLAYFKAECTRRAKRDEEAVQKALATIRKLETIIRKRQAPSMTSHGPDVRDTNHEPDVHDTSYGPDVRNTSHGPDVRVC